MTTVNSSAAELQLFAVDASGPRALAVLTQGGNVHDVLEHLPGGVYSALRTFEHRKFLWLDAHLERTERSMSGLGWTKRLDRAALCRALDAVVCAYPGTDARVRFDVLREPATLQGVSADTFIALSPFAPLPAEYLTGGVRVDFAPHLSRPTPRIKTTEFVRVRKPFPIGTRERFDHILVDAEERVLECSSANIVFVRRGELIAAGDGVLEGITLKVLRQIAEGLALKFRTERLPRAGADRHGRHAAHR
jgi:branched-subunit amino acid aminotransferase/4-amino-4-deoxychorismate lyase